MFRPWFAKEGINEPGQIEEGALALHSITIHFLSRTSIVIKTTYESVSPTMNDSLPTLPEISADVALEVYTHSSLAGAGYPDNSRLALFGEAQMKASLIAILLRINPPLSSMDITVRDLFSIPASSPEDDTGIRRTNNGRQCDDDLSQTLLVG